MLAAAVAKSYQLTTELLGWSAFTTVEALSIVLIGVEVGLAVLLLSGRYARLARWLIVICFLAFAGYSFYAGTAGHRTCGCLGKVPLSPWASLVFDLIVIGVFSFTKPVAGWQGLYRSLIPYFAGSVLLLFALSATSLLLFGSIPIGLSALAGERVVVSPTVLRMGSAERGAHREITVNVTNLDSKPVQLLGAQQCVLFYLTDKLPIELAPGEHRDLHLIAIFESASGERVRNSLLLYTSYQGQPAIYVEVNGHIVDRRRLFEGGLP